PAPGSRPDAAGRFGEHARGGMIASFMAINLPTRKVLTLEAARVALAAAEAEALKNGWRVVIAVVDEGGHSVAMVRLDGAQWSSISTAVEKARAATAWKRPTR